MQLSLANDRRKKVAVISHERSGTHFLMNSIAENFGYLAAPWWNFDFEVPINFHAAKNIEHYFRQAHDQPITNILKSHHEVGFFAECIEYLASQFHIFYIYRDPRDALVSSWKLLNQFEWDEGPKLASASQFLRAEPAAAMLRYQKIQHANMLQRWRHHVDGWLALSRAEPSLNIYSLSYEQLNLDFKQTITAIGAQLGMQAKDIQRPAKDQSVIGSGQGKVATYREHLSSDDERFVFDQVGKLMGQLGYQ